MTAQRQPLTGAEQSRRQLPFIINYFVRRRGEGMANESGVIFRRQLATSSAAARNLSIILIQLPTDITVQTQAPF